MQRLLAVVIATTVVSGCATTTENRTGMKLGGLAMGVGVTTVVISGVAYVIASKPLCGTGPSSEPVDCEEDQGAQRASGIAAIVGAALFAGGLVSRLAFESASDDTQKQENERAAAEGTLAWQRAEEQVAERQRTRDRAWTLTKEAGQAARAGDCAAVIERGREVLAIDPEFHATVFIRDVAIGGCLAKAGVITAVVPVAPPPPPRDPIKDREQAFALTKSAADAARAGTCATVRELQARVRELDTSVHDAWFVRDAAIKKCLEESN